MDLNFDMDTSDNKHSFENETRRKNSLSSLSIALVEISQSKLSTSTEICPSNQDNEYELIQTDGPMLGARESFFGDWESVFQVVEDTVGDVKQKELDTWMGKMYENVRRRAQHADRNRADLGYFLVVRLGKYGRKVLRFCDFIPVPVDTGDGNEIDWISSWAVRDEDGGISVDHLAAWANQLEREEAKNLETDNCIDQYTFVRILKNYPKKNEKYITKDEFYTMMRDYINNTDIDKMTRKKKLLQAIAYAEEFRWWPPPPFTIFIVLLEIYVFLYHFIFLKTWYENYVSKTSAAGGPVALCSKWLYHPHRKWEWWRFFTYGLVHSGPVHLIANLLVLCFVGLPLELTNKWWRVAIIYIFGILAGSLTVSILDSFVPLVGASGGIYALLGAHAANLVLNWKEDNLILQQVIRKHRRTRAIKAKGIRKIRLALIISLAMCDTAYSIYQRYYGDTNVKTSFLSHFSGAILGLVVGIIVLKNRKAENWEKILKGVCLGLTLLMLTGAIILNVMDVTSSQLHRIDMNGTVDYRLWDEALPICQDALYVSLRNNNSRCKKLNWPAFNCFDKDMCKQFNWSSPQC